MNVRALTHVLTVAGLRLQATTLANSRPVVNELLGRTDDVWRRLQCRPRRRRSGPDLLAEWTLDRPGVFEFFWAGEPRRPKQLYLLVLGPPWSVFWLRKSEVESILDRSSRSTVDVVRGMLEELHEFRELV